MTPEPLPYGSLFAGIGGFDLGFENAGMLCKWQVEIDDWCRETILRPYYPEAKRHGDIKTFPPADWGAEEPRVDVICGGSPCQDLSCAGKRAGLGGERSGLFFEMVRTIRQLRPRYVVWENVRDALSSNGGRDFRTVLGHFSDLGYTPEWTVLRASDFGYPQGRARIFVVAYRASEIRQRATPPNSGQPPLIGKELADTSEPRLEGKSESETRQGNQRAATERIDETVANTPCDNGGSGIGGTETGTRQDRIGRRRPAEPGARIPFAPPGPGDLDAWAEILKLWPWLAPAVESGFCGVVDGVSVAVDTARAKRLRALGNAVVPACAEWIARRIIEYDA